MSNSDGIPSITESQILTSYLLPPSPLPTILPYSSFLALVPATYRNNPALTSALQRLYRDLQFQRSITIDQVRENIERECGAKAASLKARLARRIAIEEGEVKAEDDPEDGSARRRKRRKVMNRSTELDEDTVQAEIKDEEESAYSSDNELTDPLHLAAHQTMYDHPSNLHPAAHVLQLPDELRLNQLESTSGSGFHTKSSLLEAMENASNSLEKEIKDLEAECTRMKENITETVGSLSDLKYGKRQSEGSGGDEEYVDVLDALEHFEDVLKAKIYPRDHTLKIGVS